MRTVVQVIIGPVWPVMAVRMLAAIIPSSRRNLFRVNHDIHWPMEITKSLKKTMRRVINNFDYGRFCYLFL